MPSFVSDIYANTYMPPCQAEMWHICYNPNVMNLGKNIEKYRKKADLSREKLAFKCGGKFTSHHLLRVERGTVKNPGIEMIKEIAKALNVTVDGLLS